MDGESRAQTNLQLLNQLRGLGYPDEEVLRIKDAYFFAAGLFPGSFRASGKPFLAHLVGTASVLASVRARIPLVAAGLLHAVYALGEFGAGWHRLSSRKEAAVRRAVGSEVEQLVARYTRLPWTAATIATVRAAAVSAAPVDHDVVLMRLANELDDLLDLNFLYYANADAHRGAVKARVDCLAEIARHLGQADLADRLRRACQEMLTAEVPAALRTTRKGSYVVMPRRGMRWLPARVRQLLGQSN